MPHIQGLGRNLKSGFGKQSEEMVWDLNGKLKNFCFSFLTLI